MKLDFGIVEDRMDELQLGRCRVRIVGVHSPDRSELPTSALPWAIPLQSITSAAVSGIGSTPLGLVEGSIVAVTYLDEDKQQPLILGSIAGIPNDGIDSIGINVDDSKKIKTADDITKYTDDATRIIYNHTPYKEIATFSDGEYIIGYKSRSIDGTPVTSNLKLSRDDADRLLAAELKVIFSEAKGLIRAPVTQSMMDAIVSIVHDIGLDAFKSSSVITEINTGKYDIAASQIQVLSGDSKRRSVEKTLFLKDGLPVEEVKVQTVNLSVNGDNAFTNPTGIYPLYRNEPDTNKLARNYDISSTVVSLKESARITGLKSAGADGSDWEQPPVPYASKYPFNKVFCSESGHLMEFDDTPGAERTHHYHKSGTFTEVDVNGTQVNRIVGDGYEVFERNGYIYVKGALSVNVEGAKNVKVAGALNLDVVGSTNINVGNDANVNVSGAVNLSAGESVAIKTVDFKLECDNFDVKVSGAAKLEAADINIKGETTKVSGIASLDLGGAVTHVHGSGSIDLKGGILTLGYAAAAAGVGLGVPAIIASPAASSGLSAPAGRGTPSTPSFSTLTVPQRQDNGNYAFETPDEGSESEVQSYIDARVKKGEVKKDALKPITEPEIKKAVEKEPPKVIEKNTKVQSPASCDVIFGMKDIPMSTQLSKYYTVRDFTANGTRPLKAQNGISAQQIACNLKGVAVNLDLIKDEFPNITITSGWRRPGDAPGSSTKSQHNTGQAVDIVFRGYSKKQVYDAVHKIAALVPFDQLILEYSGGSTVWVHYSVTYSGNRRQIFTMKNHRRVSGFGKFLLL